MKYSELSFDKVALGTCISVQTAGIKYIGILQSVTDKEITMLCPPDSTCKEIAYEEINEVYLLDPFDCLLVGYDAAGQSFPINIVGGKG